jgi:hypothetical protein
MSVENAAEESTTDERTWLKSGAVLCLFRHPGPPTLRYGVATPLPEGNPDRIFLSLVPLWKRGGYGVAGVSMVLLKKANGNILLKRGAVAPVLIALDFSMWLNYNLYS